MCVLNEYFYIHDVQLAAGFYFRNINTLVTDNFRKHFQHLILSDEKKMLYFLVVCFKSTPGVFYGNVYICNKSLFQALSNLPTLKTMLEELKS